MSKISNDFKRFVVTWDPASGASNVLCRDIAETKDKINSMFELWVKQGVDTILYRVNECGTFGYPTKIGKTWNTVKTAESNLPHEADWKALDIMLTQIDPLKEAVEAARRYGIEILVWVTPYDCYFEEKGQPAYKLWGSFEEENYHKLGVANRKGSRLRGIMEFHYPEVRNYWLKIMRELSGYDVDGIYISVKTHSWCQVGRGREEEKGATLEGEKEFGFNEPVVALYKKRYGKDPCIEEYDHDKLSAILGEGLTDFLRENRKVWAKRLVFIGKVPLSLVGLQAFPYYPIQLDLDTWASEKLIDRISAGYGDEWQVKYGDDFAHQVAEQVCPLAGDNIDVLVSALTRPSDARAWNDPHEFRRHLAVVNKTIAEDPRLSGGSYHEHEFLLHEVYGGSLELWPEFEMYRRK